MKSLLGNKNRWKSKVSTVHRAVSEVCCTVSSGMFFSALPSYLAMTVALLCFYTNVHLAFL